MIGISGESGSGISVLAPRHDDDDDIKVKISNTLQNCKCTLYDYRDEMISHKISECYKLTQKCIKLDTTT